MAVPTKEKTWEYNLGTVVSGAYNEVKGDNVYIEMKNILTSAGFTTPWRVWGSSDSVVAGNGDYVDRWIDAGDVKHASFSNAHSWIVLESPLGIHLCLDCNTDTTFNQNFMFWNNGPFNSDGTINNRPSGGVLVNNQVNMPNSASNWILNALNASDGSGTVFFVAVGGSIYHFLFTGRCDDIVNGEVWTGEYTYWNGGQSALSMNYGAFSASQLYAKMSGTDVRASCTGSGCNAVLTPSLLTVVDEDVGTPPLFEMGLFCRTTGCRGAKGRLVDMWWASAVTATGDTYPTGGTREFLQLGDLVIPWNGSVPVLT